MPQFIRDLLLIDPILQLLWGLLRLAVLAGIVIVILALLSGRCIRGICFPSLVDLQGLMGPVTGQVLEEEPDCPQFQTAFPQLLPDAWSLQRVEAVNIDQDDEKECLVIYRYNAGGGAYGGPLGGVVYDPQPDRDPRNLATPVPFRPASYIPYHLLPRADGKGFLSERAVDWSRMIQVYDADGDTFDELIFQGFAGYNFPTYLSIFKWQNKQDGYELLTRQPSGETVGGPLWGNAGITIKRATLTDEEGNEIPGPIEQIVVKHRPTTPFWYFRSQICYAKIYRWNADKTALEQWDYYLTFCFGRPRGAESGQDRYFLWYPEEALLAWYKDGQVREITIPAQPVGDTLHATVTLRDSTQQRWLVTRELPEEPERRVADMTFWRLQPIR